MRQIPEVSGALVVIDPHSGRVLALDGGLSFEMSQFDRATQAKRQIGSAIKPFVYLTAMDHGFTPASVLMDAPLEVDQGPGLPKWRPSNYDAPVLRAAHAAGRRRAIAQPHHGAARRHPRHRARSARRSSASASSITCRVDYSMVLGAGETTPLRLTAAYAMLVNGGKKITPTLIDRVQDSNGVTIYRADQRTCESCSDVDWTEQPPPMLADNREQIADPRSAYQIVSILQGVIERGTGHVIASLGRPLAGKTGTTNDSNDTWFVGFSPDLAVGVFVGYDQPRASASTRPAARSRRRSSATSWRRRSRTRRPSPSAFRPGSSSCGSTPRLASSPRLGDKKIIYEAFKPGTEPAGEGPAMAGGTAVHGDDEDAASMAPTTDDGSAAPTAVDTTAGSAPAATPATSASRAARPRRGPAGFTDSDWCPSALLPARLHLLIAASAGWPARDALCYVAPVLTKGSGNASGDRSGGRGDQALVVAAQEASLTGTMRRGASPS